MTSIKKKIRVKKYLYQIMNYQIVIDECVLYVDDIIDEESFDPKLHKHFLPKFEQARALVILAARQGQTIQLTSKDKDEDL